MLHPETIALLEAATLAEREIEKALSFASLSTTQYRLMELVGETPGIKPTVLAARLLQEAHSVSGLLNRLEDRNIVARRHDREDLRVVHIDLTAEGRVLLLACRDRVAPVEARMAAHLIDADDSVADLRDRLVGRLVSPLNRARRTVSID